jgi:uncharacterized membrane protein
MNEKVRAVLLPLLAALLLVSPSVPPASAQKAAQAPDPFFASVSRILQSRCYSCHAWAGSPEGMADPRRVAPGNAEGSELYRRVSTGSMPMGSAPLTSEELAVVHTWIEQGAPTGELPTRVAGPDAPAPPYPSAAAGGASGPHAPIPQPCPCGLQ